MIQLDIDHGGRPAVGWQFLAYVILSAGEVMVSITGLEFAYTQAPNRMKSLSWRCGSYRSPSAIRFIDHQLPHSKAQIDGHESRRRKLLQVFHPADAGDIDHLRFCCHVTITNATYLQSQDEPMP